MYLDSSVPVKVKFSMDSYAKKIVESFAQHIGNTKSTLELDHLFNVRANEARKRLL